MAKKPGFFRVLAPQMAFYPQHGTGKLSHSPSRNGGKKFWGGPTTFRPPRGYYISKKGLKVPPNYPKMAKNRFFRVLAPQMAFLPPTWYGKVVPFTEPERRKKIVGGPDHPPTT